MYKTSAYTLVNGDMNEWHIENSKNHKQVIIIKQQIDRRCDGEWYHLFMIFAVFDVSLIHVAVNKCTNWCFVHL